MVKIKFNRDYFEVSGHSGYAPKGMDIVCAGVSACVIGGINALEKEYKTIFKDGYIKVFLEEEMSEWDMAVITTIFTQLVSIQMEFPKYVSVEMEGIAV